MDRRAAAAAGRLLRAVGPRDRRRGGHAALHGGQLESARLRRERLSSHRRAGRVKSGEPRKRERWGNGPRRRGRFGKARAICRSGRKLEGCAFSLHDALPILEVSRDFGVTWTKAALAAPKGRYDW